MRLRFSYLIAAGTEGECRVRVAQYKDTPTSWRMLNDAGFEKCLKVVGRWTQVEHVFTTDAEATTLALDFRIAGDTDIGEMWIDDVSLEPVGMPGACGAVSHGLPVGAGVGGRPDRGSPPSQRKGVQDPRPTSDRIAD